MLKPIAALLALLISAAAAAQVAAVEVDVNGAWARATVPGQQGTGAFMTLRAGEPMQLIGAASSVAGVVEIHEMAMDGNVMRMRAIEKLELPANTPVQLRPGGHHMMLMDLRRPLKRGEKITVELQLQTRDGKRVTQPLQIEVRSEPPARR